MDMSLNPFSFASSTMREIARSSLADLMRTPKSFSRYFLKLASYNISGGTVGAAEGERVGDGVGLRVGARVGESDGAIVGKRVGVLDGAFVGL